jgi:phage shock protein A
MAGSTFRRVKNIVRAEIDDLLAKVEDPRKMVNQMILDMESAFEEAIAEVSRSVASEKILDRKIREKRQEAERLESQAGELVAKGEDEAARAVLDRKVALEAALATLENAHREASEVSERLKRQLAELKVKLEAARAKRGSVAIRKAVARRGVTGPDELKLNAEAFSAFDRYCQTVERDEIAAEVYREIAETRPQDDDYDRLARRRRIDEELARIKKRLESPADGS